MGKHPKDLIVREALDRETHYFLCFLSLLWSDYQLEGKVKGLGRKGKTINHILFANGVLFLKRVSIA